MFPPLLLITNPDHEDAAEDRELACFLSDTFDVTLGSPTMPDAAAFPRWLIRNAWPNRMFVKAFERLKEIADRTGIRVYNPFDADGLKEDKSYLAELWQEKFPVIPTVLSANDICRLPKSDRYVVKPIDGCSSEGVRTISKDSFATISPQEIIQPLIDFLHEVSFYFIDDVLVYALRSAGSKQRWDLTEFTPSTSDLAWASRFVAWNAMPYGLQRIDACRLADGSLLLMEIEDQMPVLSLDVLTSKTLAKFVIQFKSSLLRHLR